MVKEDKTTTSDVKDSTSTEAPPNIVTSWGNGKTTAAPGQGQKSVPAQPRRVSKRPVPRNEKPTAVTTPPLLKKRRSSTSQPARRSGASARRSVRLRSKPAIASKTSDTASNTTQQKSTEQQELERIEALQKEVAEQRRKNEASYRAALAGSQPPKKHVLSTTIPKEFNFRSDSRVKNHMDGASADDNSYKEVDFTSQLRKHPSSPLKAPKGTTIPKPFNLSRGKRKLDEAGAYVPMAQQIEQFQKRTPTRYHLRSRQSQERGPSPLKTEKPKITHPKTPQLLTRQRHRPTMVKSTAEIEAEEAEKLQQFKFKALELNRKILEGALVPKKPASKEATKPEGFQLEIEKRLQERQACKKPEEKEDTTFHPRPLPTRILEEVVGVPEKKVLNPTVPESPAFALKNRVRMEKKKEEEKPPAPIKAHPVPHFLPFQPKLPVKSQVEMCPFSFEERERERKAMKEKRLEEMRNEEVPKFKAQPLPDFHEVHLPEKKVVEPTKPAPFKLMVDERGAAKGERWEQMMKEELKRQAEGACFKARPNVVSHKEPFVPKKENRSILANTTNSAVPEGFQLATERRAKERMEFEKELSEREALKARMEEERAREREEQEKDEIARLRQEQVRKAQPIRRYKPVELKKSDVSLTVPQSPNFSDRFRLMGFAVSTLFVLERLCAPSAGPALRASIISLLFRTVCSNPWRKTYVLYTGQKSLQHNLHSMSVKGSMKCPLPPSSPTTLEAKVDDLRFKVEQLLLSPEKSCPMCGTCVQHRTLQETVTSQLSAQTRLLDSLEKKVLEMRTALEELARGLEDRQCERVSVPLVALQRRKSLPVRTSAEEVYVRLDRERKMAPHAFDLPSEEGILLEINENNGTTREHHQAKKDSTHAKVQHELKLQSKEERGTSTVTPRADLSQHQTQKMNKVENKNMPPNQNNVPKPVIAAPVVTQKTQSIAPPKRETQDDKKVSPPNTKAPVSVTTAGVLPNTNVKKHNEAVNVTLPNHTVAKTTGLVAPAIPQCTASLVPNNPPKLTTSEVPTDPTPFPKASLGPPVATAQSSGKSSVNAPTTKTTTSQEATLLPPSHKPPKTMGLNVTTATKEAFALRQVQSCPNSLQRLQATGGKSGLVHPVSAPLAKKATEVVGAANHILGGIQIKITPATDKNPVQMKSNNPPKTCFKVIDDVSPQPAPFAHRFVALKSNPPPSDTFNIHTREVLGGGRFGKVHKCTETKTGMRLAAKIINTRNARERDMALNEIQVMNQLSHPNVLQLYEAFEVKNQVVLILEYVEGGELFERIVDESCPLTEVDAMVFIKQICEGVQYMHQMYVLHLDLKPENILLVNRSSHQVKIIDFGLARRYKPREKLKVSFGTPEFLAPEVVNFDFVSFPTDMWTLGVVTYMLLSGLSPFLGDDDSQTLNNVLMGNWYFDEDAFEHVSAEARNFVSNLLIRERSGRLSATQCLKHPWLNNITEKAKSSNIVLKSQVLLKKYMARRLWKKNYIAVAAANRFKKIGSSGSLTTLGI
ncbi:hypothetical protein QQF64_021205 [Cirrhinus molitorella]|uniref:Protein kinase domain-containing protein n=1 Tax=Cirrhinus molitorella TaxID=172907 RepID=A0ABR3LCS3_9TELE